MSGLKYLICFLFIKLVYNAEELKFVPINELVLDSSTSVLSATLNVAECSILMITNDLGETTEHMLGMTTRLTYSTMALYGDNLKVGRTSVDYGYRCIKTNGDEIVFHLLRINFIETTGLKFLNSRLFYADGVKCDFSVNPQCSYGHLVSGGVLINCKSLKDNLFVEVTSTNTQTTYKMFGLLDTSLDDATKINLNRCVGSTLVQKKSHECDPDLDPTCIESSNPPISRPVSYFRYSCRDNAIVYVHDFIHVCRNGQRSRYCTDGEYAKYSIALYENNILTLEIGSCTRVVLNNQEYSLSSAIADPNLHQFLTRNRRIQIILTQPFNELKCYSGSTVWSANVFKVPKSQTSPARFYQRRGDVESIHYKIFVKLDGQYVDASMFL